MAPIISDHASVRDDALHLYEDFGAHCVQHLRGEFAFVLWEELNRLLSAARAIGLASSRFTTLCMTTHCISPLR